MSPEGYCPDLSREVKTKLPVAAPESAPACPSLRPWQQILNRVWYERRAAVVASVDDEQNTENLPVNQEKQDSEQWPEQVESLSEFYALLTHPFDDPGTRDRVIEFFADWIQDPTDFYTAIQQIDLHGKADAVNDPAAVARLEQHGMDYVRAQVTAIPDGEPGLERVRQIFAAYGQDLTKYPLALTQTLLDRLHRVGEMLRQDEQIQSLAALEAAIAGLSPAEQEELQYVTPLLRWKSEQPGWTYISSDELTLGARRHPRTQHRFYLNTDANYTHQVVDALVGGYQDREMPFHLKFAPRGEFWEADRNDTVVIYCHDSQLLGNLELLRELKAEHPEWSAHFHRPPILTAQIEGWLGYGSEPAQPNTSYSTVRANLLRLSLYRAVNDYSALQSPSGAPLRGEERDRFVQTLVGDEQFTRWWRARFDAEVQAAGIDSEKFCFDQGVRERLARFDQEHELARKMASREQTGEVNEEKSEQNNEKKPENKEKQLGTLREELTKLVSSDRRWRGIVRSANQGRFQSERQLIETINAEYERYAQDLAHRLTKESPDQKDRVYQEILAITGLETKKKRVAIDRARARVDGWTHTHTGRVHEDGFRSAFARLARALDAADQGELVGAVRAWGERTVRQGRLVPDRQVWADLRGQIQGLSDQMREQTDWKSRLDTGAQFDYHEQEARVRELLAPSE